MTEGRVRGGIADADGSERCVCGKVPYRSYGQAKAAMNLLKRYRRDRADEGVLRPYRCEARRYVWHVGHASV